MKKLYSCLAAAVVALSATAAAPQSSLTKFSVSAAEVTDLSVAKIENPAMPSSRNAWAAAPSRVPAAESMIDLSDTTMVFTNNCHVVVAQGDFYEFYLNKIRPVKGKENTYEFDFFQFFSDLTFKPVEGVLDPETGVISVNSDVVLGSTVHNGAVWEARLRPYVVADSIIATDEPIEFMLGQGCISATQLIGVEITDLSTNSSWPTLLIPEMQIGPCNTIATDVLGVPRKNANGEVSLVEADRMYGLFSYPVDGKKIVFMNAFGCGGWSYEIEGVLDMNRKTLTFDDAMLYEDYDGKANIPIMLADGNGSTYVEIDYSDNVAIMGQTDRGFELAGYLLCALYFDGKKDWVFKSFKDVKIVPLVNYFDAMAGTAEIEADNANAPVEFFNLQGVRVNNPENGVYIRRQGSDVRKVLVK